MSLHINIKVDQKKIVIESDSVSVENLNEIKELIEFLSQQHNMPVQQWEVVPKIVEVPTYTYPYVPSTPQYWPTTLPDPWETTISGGIHLASN